jgi:hypothetical protein
MDANRRDRNEHSDALAAAGLALEQGRLVAGQRRFRLDSIAVYGPEERPRHYRAPVIAFGAGLVSVLIPFGLLDGLGSTAGLVVFGLGILLFIDASALMWIARREPSLELITVAGTRHSIPLPEPTLMPHVLAALDDAMGGGGRR